jgi:ketosteroid isomerase-like protein
MNHVRVAIATLLALLAARSFADAADIDVLLPIQTFVRAANAGDRAMLISIFTPDSMIIDEFAPFRFAAPQAAAHWYDGSGPDQTAHGVTDARISVAAPTFITVKGSHAYVVVPAIYAYKIHGKPATETGSVTYSLIRRNAKWKISAMAWAKLTDTSIP